MHILSNIHIILFTKIFLILLTSHIARQIIKKVFYQLYKKFKHSNSDIDTNLLIAIKKPLYFLIWIKAIAMSLRLLSGAYYISVLSLINSISTIANYICIAWFLMRFVDQCKRRFVLNRQENNIKIDYTTLGAIVRFSKAIMVIIIIILMLDKLGFQFKGILAFGGISGIAVGFASKDMLSNIFGAILIYLDKPFVVGDWICSPDKSLEGVVEDIGWRQTVIMSFSEYPIYIPNSLFSTIIIENRSRIDSLRIDIKVGVRYCDISKVRNITKDIKEMLNNNIMVNKKKMLRVFLNKFNSSSLDIDVTFFVVTKSWQEHLVIKQAVMIEISKIVENNGAEIAFPTSTIHLNKVES